MAAPAKCSCNSLTYTWDSFSWPLPLDLAHGIAPLSHPSMPSVTAAMLQQYMNRELPDVQAGFRKGRGTRDQIANICWMIKEAKEFQKNIYFCFIDYAKAFECVDHSKLWKIMKEMGIPDHLTCLLRNLYAGQEATVRTGYGKTGWFQIGKGVYQGCISSPYLFNFPGGLDGKASACSAGDMGLISGMGRSPGEGNDNPLQYSCLENYMD